MTRVRLLRSSFVFALLVSTFAIASPLEPVKTDNPRDTMRSFMLAMEDYRKGVESEDSQLTNRIEDAARTLNLKDYPVLIRAEKGRETAVLLKEVLDRIIVIDYSLVPDGPTTGPDALQRWRLKGSEIVISKVEEGERAGEYLFSPATVERVPEFFAKVRDLPYLEGTGGGAHFSPPWVEVYIPKWAQESFLGFQKWQWAGLFLAILLGLILRGLTRFFLRGFKIFTMKSTAQWDDRLIEAIEKPASWIVLGAFWFLSIHILRFEGLPLTVLTVVVQIIFSAALIWALYRSTDVFVDYLRLALQKTGTRLDDHLTPLISRSIKIFVAIVGTLVAVQNLGINVVSLMAGLGLGGLAFALAAKDMASNLFGSIMIFMDRPFRVGDWIVVGDGTQGTVEFIGFRSTRIRTFHNSQIYVPNSAVANATIDNMGRRQFRRVYATIGITYDTSPEKMEAFLEGIKNIIKANPTTRKDYFHVVFDSYGDYRLNVLLYFFLKVPDWSAELVERQNIYLEILRLAHELEVRFALPTQTLHVESFPEKQPTRRPSAGDPRSLKEVPESFGPGGARSKHAGLGYFTPPYKEDTGA